MDAWVFPLRVKSMPKKAARETEYQAARVPVLMFFIMASSKPALLIFNE